MIIMRRANNSITLTERVIITITMAVIKEALIRIIKVETQEEDTIIKEDEQQYIDFSNTKIDRSTMRIYIKRLLPIDFFTLA